MPRFNARWLSLLAITLIALYLCWLIIAPFMDVILWAAVLAIIALPYHRKLRDRGLGPNTAAVVSTIGVCLVIIIPVALVVAAMATQIPNKDQIMGWFDQLKEIIAPGSRVYRIVDPYYDLDRFQDPATLKSYVSPYTQKALQITLGIVYSLLGSGVSITFALFTLFYLLRDNHKIGAAIANALPLKKEQSKHVFHRCDEIIQASVQGVLFISAIQGAMGAAAYWVLGVPGFILWGVVMFVTSMIPALGAVVAWVPIAIFLAATGHWWKALILAVWGGAIIGSVDNFLRPRLVGSKTGMHDLVIFFSVLGGLQVFGILGLFVGLVVVAVAVAIFEVFRQAGAEGTTLEAPPEMVMENGPALETMPHGTPMIVAHEEDR